MNTKEVVKPAVVLLLISAVAAACLGAVSEITAEPIALQNEKTLNESMQAVMPEASSFEQLTDAELTGTITAVSQAPKHPVWAQKQQNPISMNSSPANPAA